ncbi:hypothetical protein BDV96DRAFT_654328 [Lophiotrema nucula]|uniref:Uncharacterized protein n=1 Tax=Lophiotrema nucula TaxID=690887 RepID=A0A6A5YJ54_9PLEO|nr:hypothetical protein BDV96DRAFT_654328 [Lophiotrema nucula]
MPSCTTSDAGYILDLISTYASHQCQPHKRNLTMLARYIPLRPWSSVSVVLKGFFWGVLNFIDALMSETLEDHHDIRPSKYSKRTLKQTLRTYADIIEKFSPNKRFRLVLGRALAMTQTDLGVRTLGNKEHTFWLLCKWEFQDISKNLEEWSSQR